MKLFESVSHCCAAPIHLGLTMVITSSRRAPRSNAVTHFPNTPSASTFKKLWRGKMVLHQPAVAS